MPLKRKLLPLVRLHTSTNSILMILLLTKDTLKTLGVVLDSKLTFKAHIKEQLNKACAKASALPRIRKFISKDVLVRLYKAYFLLT